MYEMVVDALLKGSVRKITKIVDLAGYGGAKKLLITEQLHREAECMNQLVAY